MIETLRAEFEKWASGRVADRPLDLTPCINESCCCGPHYINDDTNWAWTAFQAGRESASKGEGQVTAREWMRQTGEHGTELRSLVGEELWNQILCDMDEFAETRRTSDCESDTGFGDFPKGRARLEHAPSSPGSESKFREELCLRIGVDWPATDEEILKSLAVVVKLAAEPRTSPGSERPANEAMISLQNLPKRKPHVIVEAEPEREADGWVSVKTPPEFNGPVYFFVRGVGIRTGWYDGCHHTPWWNLDQCRDPNISLERYTDEQVALWMNRPQPKWPAPPRSETEGR